MYHFCKILARNVWEFDWGTAALLGTEKRFGRKHRSVMFLRCPSLNCFFDAELEFLPTHYFKMLEDKYVEYSVHTSLKQRLYEIGLTIIRGKILGNSSLASSSAIYYNAERFFWKLLFSQIFLNICLLSKYPCRECSLGLFCWEPRKLISRVASQSAI